MTLKTEEEFPLPENSRQAFTHLQTQKKQSIKLQAHQLPDQDLLQEQRHLTVLLIDFLEGRITKQSFMAQLIDWSYYFVFEKGGYIPHLLPSKPFSVSEFDKLDKDEIKSLSFEHLSKVREIKTKWMDECRKARVYNNSDRLWLVRMLSYYIFKEDTGKMESIKNRLKLYEGTT